MVIDSERGGRGGGCWVDVEVIPGQRITRVSGMMTGQLEAFMATDSFISQ